MKSAFTFLFAWLLCWSAALWAQSPSGLSYQAALRTAQGQLMTNQFLSASFELRQGSATGTAVYRETQNLQTNEYGLLTATVGQGSSSDDFDAIDWATGPYFLSVAVDLGNGSVDIGTTQLLSVPYALYAERAANVDDADADPNNELQNLSFFNQRLAISQGDTVDLSSLKEDADADPNNENQSLALNGKTLSISNGNSVDLGPAVEDADADSTNELQDIALNNNQLSLTKGSTVDLSSLIDDADPDPSNEIQRLNLNGTTLAISRGNAINLQPIVDDADADPSNELQSLSLSNGNLSLSNGNSVDLSNLRGTLVDFAFASGTGNAPNSSTRFLVAPATITITNRDQRVLVISHGLLGNSNLVSGSADLDLSIGYRFAGTTALNTVSPGMVNCRIGPNQRQNFGLSVMLTDLSPGDYEFGLCGDDDGNGNWNSNGAGYTTILLFN